MTISIPWRPLLTGAIALGMTATILSSVLAPSPTIPRPEDIAQAGRVAAPAVGEDERFSQPEGTWVAGNGVVEPADREVRVAAAVAGRVAEVRVREGDRVAAGDVLLLLEQDVEAAAAQAATADVAAARAELDRLRAGARSQDIDAARHEAAAARERAAQTADALRRTDELAAAGHAAPDALERARRQAAADAETASQAEARLRLLQAGTRAEEVAAADARLQAALAREAEAQARLAQRTVRAPSAGEILQLFVRPGEHQQPGGADPLVILGDTSALRVRMDLDERDLGRVLPNAAARVRAVAFPGQDFPARVVEVGRRMGRKNLRTDDPVERNDTKVLEIVLTLDGSTPLVVGQRVVVYVEPGGRPG
jgi:HlyD family secretion protein